MLLLLMFACGGPPSTSERCDCPVEGHGARTCEGGDCGPCQCLPSLDPTPDPDPATTFWVRPGGDGDGSEADPWGEPDWAAVDDALAAGPVEVRFDAAAPFEGRLEVAREDDGPHRLVLNGRGWRFDGGWTADPDARAVVPGVTTGFEVPPRHRVTVRGFEITGSRAQGVHWDAGDDIVLEDLVVHDNAGSPAISFQYASRSGHASTSVVVRNNHVFDQRGECIYIGGAEGLVDAAHEYVRVENNLVHHCWHRMSNQHDGINVKDRIGEAVVRRNVVFVTDWGIEVGSPGLVEQNLVFDTGRDAYHLSDAWDASLSGLILRDDVAIRAGERGIRLGGDDAPAEDVRFERLTILDSAGAAIALAGEAGASVALVDVVLAGNAEAMEQWGDVTVDVQGCRLEGEPGSLDGCVDATVPRDGLDVPAGPDGLFFTEDDPWRVEGGAAPP